MKADIVESYLKYNKLTLQSGSLETNEIMMPYLLMDLVLQIYDNEIKPLKCQHEKNHWKKEWGRQYNEFNEQFFAAFDQDQTDAIIDVMDGLSDAVAEEVAVLRVELDRRLTKVPEMERKVCTACLMADVFTKAAMSFYGHIFAGKFMTAIRLGKIKTAIVNLLRQYYTGTETIILNNDNAISEATGKLSRKIASYAVQRF